MTEVTASGNEHKSCRNCGAGFDESGYTLCPSCWNDWKLGEGSERGPVGNGWMPLVRSVHAQLVAIAPSYRIAQIKEKFGGLRFYFDAIGVDEQTQEQMDEIVRAAETQAYTVCEICGADGAPRRRSWVKTLCDGCADGAPLLQIQRYSA